MPCSSKKVVLVICLIPGIRAYLQAWLARKEETRDAGVLAIAEDIPSELIERRPRFTVPQLEELPGAPDPSPDSHVFPPDAAKSARIAASAPDILRLMTHLSLVDLHIHMTQHEALSCSVSSLTSLIPSNCPFLFTWLDTFLRSEERLEEAFSGGVGSAGTSPRVRHRGGT